MKIKSAPLSFPAVKCLLLEMVDVPVVSNPNKVWLHRNEQGGGRGQSCKTFCFQGIHHNYPIVSIFFFFAFNMIDSHILYLYINLGILFFDWVDEY